MQKLPLIVLCCVFLSPLAVAKDVERGLIDRIDSANRHLQETERRINRMRSRLVTELNALQKEVLALEEKTALARRLEDEKTLSLSQLQERLDSWQQQQVYQQNLLTRFLRRHVPGNEYNGTGLSAGIAAVSDLSKNIQQRLQPAWREQAVILDNGELKTLPTLNLGPVTWYWQAEQRRAGFAENDKAGLKSVMLLGSGASGGLQALLDHNTGSISFDPTLGRALAREQNTESVYEHIAKGGLWVIPILLAAMVALVIAFIKGWQLWRLPRLLRFNPAELQQLLRTRDSEPPATIGDMQRDLIEIGRSESSAQRRDDRLFIALGDAKSRLEHGIGAIAITAAISPLLGLLGTVSGMIETFKMMTLFGSSDPEVVSGGIAQALVTTELGLIVAIPALILNALLSRWAKSHYDELESFALLISQSDSAAGTAAESQVPSESEQKPQANTGAQGMQWVRV